MADSKLTALSPIATPADADIIYIVDDVAGTPTSAKITRGDFLQVGTELQAYDADTAKYDDATANFTGTLQNGGSNVVVDTDIGSTVQGYSAVLAATTASFLTADETKLDAIEALADVTDATNVEAAGAVMDGDFTANGAMERTGAGTYVTILNKRDATTGPTANDDTGSGYSVGSRWIDVTNDKEYVCLDNTSTAAVWTETTQAGSTPTEHISIAVSDETTDLTTGTAKTTFRMPYAFTLSSVRASVTTAPTGSVLTVDINEGGTTILSTKITIDATEKTSTTAATAPVISDSSLADDAEMTIDIDTVGSTVAGAGLKVYLIGTKT